MKKRKILYLLIALITFSCNKSVEPNEKFELKVKPVSKETLERIYISLKNTNAFDSRERVNIIKQLNTNSSNLRNLEEDITNIIQPLVENGRQIHNEMLGYISGSEEWNTLSEQDKNTILNLSDPQLAALSFQYVSVIQPNGGVNEAAIKDCVGVALGIHGLKTILTDIFVAPTISGTISLLKFMGRRYIGYIGIAWMVWDFYDCMSHF